MSLRDSVSFAALFYSAPGYYILKEINLQFTTLKTFWIIESDSGNGRYLVVNSKKAAFNGNFAGAFSYLYEEA